jgi:fructose-bisphosphate aldolase class II
MALVSVKDLMVEADKGSYAVGAFNLNNLEILQAIIAAAEAERAPVILQASQGAIKYAGIKYIVAMAKVAAEEASIPVALNLDHGTSFEQAMRCIRAGFSAVMIDGSKYDFEENVKLTKRVVDVAHAVGVSVEGELGRIGGTEDDISVDEKDAFLTPTDSAVEFSERTGVDLLAVSIGTAHGVYKGEPKLDFQRLKEINSMVNIPIVLHGASGISDKDIQTAISLGVRKINIDTEIRMAFVKGINGVLAENPDEIDPRKILGRAREEMTAIVRQKIRLFGSNGKGGTH